MDVNANTDPKTGQIGSFYIRFSEADVAKTVPLKDAADPAMLVDLDAGGQIVGIEVLALDMIRTMCNLISNNLPKPYKGKVQQLCEIA
jgi:hypothetical protein